MIATAPVSEHDLDDLDAGSRLFVAGHRWALETAEPATVRTAGAATPALTVPVATPAGLLVSKTHALGYARAQRRSMKQGSDLLDIYRLVERHGSDDRLAAALHTAPGRLAPVVADVLRSAYLANPARAARRMDVPGSVRIDGTEIADVIGRFVDDLDRG